MIFLERKGPSLKLYGPQTGVTGADDDKQKSVPSDVTPPRDVYWFCENCAHRGLPNGPYICGIYEVCCNCESPRPDTLPRYGSVLETDFPPTA